MKTLTHISTVPTRLAAACALALACVSGQAAQTDIAPAPMAQASTAVVKPNLMFILDDSGSMDRDYMPDSVPGNYCRDDDSTLNDCEFGMPAYNAAQFNTIHYNPTITYTPPVNYDGTSFESYNTNAEWQAVPNDGFGIQFSGTTNLLTQYPDYVYCTTNSPSTAQRTPPFTNATTCRRPIQGGVWTYPTSSVSSRQNVAGDKPPYYYTITGVTWCTDRDGTAGFGTGTLNSATTPSCSTKQDAPFNSTVTFQYPKYGSAGNNGFTRIDVIPTVTSYTKAATRTDCAGTSCTYTEEMTNFANWYAYYRTRMQMMKSAAGLAFKAIDDRYRVGFITINPGSPVSTNKYLKITDFTAGSGNQKEAWYKIFYQQNPSPATPLREALSRVGRHFAGQKDRINDGMNDDPIQYSCQQNFAILSTDGYWNGNSGKELDGNTTMGNYDNNLAAAPRPLFDGSTETTTATTSTTRTQNVCTSNNTVLGTTCGCATNFKRVKQQTVVQTTTVVSRDGTQLSSNTGSANTTTQDITACNATVTTTVTPVTVVEEQKVAGTNATTFSAINGVTAGMNANGTCASNGQARIKRRTTTYNRTVVTTDGVAGSPTFSGTTYAFADVGSCVAVTTVQVFAQTEVTQRVAPEGNNVSTGFSAAANGVNNNTTYSCSGSGTRTILLQRTTGYNRTVTTIGLVAPVTTYSGNTSGPTYVLNNSCDTSAKTANSNITFNLTSTTITGGPTPAATTTTNGTATSTTTGSTITTADFTIPGGGPQTTTSATSSAVVGFGNTLADVAQYYYINDLRGNGSLGTAVGTPPTQLDVGTDNNVPGQSNADPQNDSASHQHMTTFTVGLGLDGTLTYDPNYRSNPTGDFLAIRNGSKQWPEPKGDTATAVDDLWHAAVNGRGKYFSAKNPASLGAGLTEALAGVNAVVGAAAAAATSNLEPVAGDNFIYVASYETVKWAGELEALTIDLATGNVVTTATWTAQSQLNTLAGSTSPGGGARSIKRFRSGVTNNLEEFTLANLSATGDDKYFAAAWIGTGSLPLSQWSSLSATQQTTAAGNNLVNYIRGDTTNQRNAVNLTGVYRDREHVLGDVVNAQPVHVRGAPASYVDAGYGTFKGCVISGGAGCTSVFNGPRVSTVYIAANDGMLHAINGQTGAERWAFIPNMVIPNLYKLADIDYASRHSYFVDGSPTVGDVYDTAAAKWKTILVGGLNSGGRGYYALDITDPLAPKGLWEFTSRDAAACPATTVLNVDKSDCDLGLTYGNPVITKLGNGEWVVMVTSGYNNVSPGDGKGYLYVLDAITGVVKKKIKAANTSQGIDPGSTTDPSGLAKIAAWVDAGSVNNTTLRVYGGDLMGNVWRFDTDGGSAYAIAELSDSSGVAQSVTTKPELGEVNGKAMIFVGTGRYLGTSDLVSSQVQTLYGIKDATEGVAPAAPILVRKGTLVEQTMTNTTDATGTAIRTLTSNPVDLASKDGWIIDLPTKGERVNVDPRLVLGTLLVLSNVPESSACTPGGFSYLNFIDYKTGSFVASSEGGVAGVRISSFGVGVNVVKLGETIKAIVTTSKKEYPDYDPPIETSAPQGHRSSWRELME
jgi:type IV pilus assembly protein PilY1